MFLMEDKIEALNVTDVNDKLNYVCVPSLQMWPWLLPSPPTVLTERNDGVLF